MEKNKDNKHYTIKKIYKKEKKYQAMKLKDSDEYLKSEGLGIIQLSTITALTTPITGLGVIYDLPMWLTLSPFLINAVPVVLGVRLLFFRKRLYDLEEELSNIHKQMSEKETNQLEELIVNSSKKGKDEYRRTRRNTTK